MSDHVLTIISSTGCISVNLYIFEQFRQYQYNTAFFHLPPKHNSNLAASAMITDTARIHFPPYLLISAQDHRGWGKSDAASASYTSARDVILEMGDVEAAYAYILRDASCLYTI
jgi:hypothetical protein